jgi:hypothetical protein
MAINVLRGIAQQAVSSGINKIAGNIRSGLLSAINSELPQTLSPFSQLEKTPNKFSTKNFSFPIDVEAPPGMGNQGHYIMFYINKQQGATIKFGTAGQSTEGSKNLKKERKNNGGKDVQQGNPADQGFENIEEYEVAVQSAKYKELSTTFVERPATIRMDTAIALYMPPQVQVSYGADYTDTEIGSAAAIGAAAYSDIMSGQGTADVVGSSLKKLGPELGDGMIRMALGAIDMIPGLEGAMEVVEMQRGFIRAPRMELAFKGIPKRAFTYDFKMIPKSSEEAEQIQNIIMAFKTNMLPEMVDGSARRQKIPSTFNIEYMYNGKENQSLHKISTCVLESMNVTYGGDRYKTYEGGVPVETSISLSFKEMDLITADKAAQGF